MEDWGLAFRQTLVLLVVLPAGTATVASLAGRGALSGAVSGAAMAVAIAVVYCWLGVFGDPDRAGWLGDR